MAKKYRYGSEELFDLKPTLSEAMIANPLKSILLLGFTYTLGAVIGRERSVAGARRGLSLAGRGARFATDKVRDIARKDVGARNTILDIEYVNPPLYQQKKEIEEL